MSAAAPPVAARFKLTHFKLAFSGFARNIAPPIWNLML